LNKKSVISLFSLLTIYCFVISSTASAHHFIWLVHDPAKQLSTWVNDESRASWWFINGVSTTYTADSSIQSEVNTAVSNWNAKIPQVRISGSGSDLIFNYSDSVCSSSAVACHSVDAIYTSGLLGGNHTIKSKITITSSSPNKTRSAAHEIGHYLGLHEQYVDVGTVTCNNSIESVMDASGCDTHLNRPSDTDKFRVDNYLGNGWATNVNIYNIGGIRTVGFLDYSYGEAYYEVKIKKNVGGVWTTVQTVTTTNNTALVGGLSWRSDIGPGVPIAQLQSGSYRAEVRPYFSSYGRFGLLASKDFTV